MRNNWTGASSLPAARTSAKNDFGGRDKRFGASLEMHCINYKAKKYCPIIQPTCHRGNASQFHSVLIAAGSRDKYSSARSNASEYSSLTAHLARQVHPCRATVRG